MPFKKGHKDRFQAENPLEAVPLCIKLPVGLRDRIRTIPNWQNKVRDLLSQFAQESESESEQVKTSDIEADR